MRRFFSLMLAGTFSAAAFAAQPLLSPQELRAKLSDPQVRVIDIRDVKSYGENHIPGAVNAPYAQWRGPASSPGELPPLTQLTQLVQSLGLTPASHAVVVSSGADATDFGASARVYWTLKILGLKELSVVNGGMKAWTQANAPLSNEVVKVAASTYQPKLDNTWIATKAEISQRIKSGGATLVDARPANFYNGEVKAPAAKVAGTLPTAVNFSFDKWFVPGSSVFVPADQARQIAAASSINGAQDTVCFCNTGHWAAIDWFARSEVLGQKNVKLYPGSMAEWSQDSTLAMENVPSRARQLMLDAKNWADRTFK